MEGYAHQLLFQSIPPEEIMMWGKKCLWRPEVLLQGSLPFLLWLPFAIKKKQQLRWTIEFLFWITWVEVNMTVKATAKPLILLCKARVWTLNCIVCFTVSLSFVHVLPHGIAFLLKLCELLINGGKHTEHLTSSKEKESPIGLYISKEVSDSISSSLRQFFWGKQVPRSRKSHKESSSSVAVGFTTLEISVGILLLEEELQPWDDSSDGQGSREYLKWPWVLGVSGDWILSISPFSSIAAERKSEMFEVCQTRHYTRTAWHCAWEPGKVCLFSWI